MTRPITRVLRHFLCLTLALLLALSSVGFVAARHKAAGAQTFVICTGYGLVRISLDAQGAPIEQTVPCPDCMVTAQATVAAPPGPMVWDAPVHAALWPAAPWIGDGGRKVTSRHARAPPPHFG